MDRDGKPVTVKPARAAILNLRCVICGQPIEEARAQRSVTCTPTCQAELKKRRRSDLAQRHCRWCFRYLRKSERRQTKGTRNA